VSFNDIGMNRLISSLKSDFQYYLIIQMLISLTKTCFNSILPGKKTNNRYILYYMEITEGKKLFDKNVFYF